MDYLRMYFHFIIMSSSGDLRITFYRRFIAESKMQNSLKRQEEIETHNYEDLETKEIAFGLRFLFFRQRISAV